MENDDLMTPPWLIPMLRANYFVTCPIHSQSSNLFCLDCSNDPFCSYCLIHHRDHRVVQIRRLSYHDVVRVNEIQKYIDVSCVQTYVLDSAKILFLNKRPQLRIGKSLNQTCQICSRNLIDSVRFCSIACKHEGIKNGDDPNLTFSLGDSAEIRISRLIDRISIAVDDQRTGTSSEMSTISLVAESQCYFALHSRFS